MVPPKPATYNEAGGGAVVGELGVAHLPSGERSLGAKESPVPIGKVAICMVDFPRFQVSFLESIDHHWFIPYKEIPT